MEVWPTAFRAGPPPTMHEKPATPTSPIAMPTGTRSSIKPNSATKPMMAMRSVLMSASFYRLDLLFRELFGLEHQPIGADGNEQDGGYVAGPGNGEEWPSRQPQIEGE